MEVSRLRTSKARCTSQLCLSILESAVKCSLGANTLKVDPEPYQCLSDLRADTNKHDPCTQELNALCSLQQVVSDSGIKDRNTGDVNYDVLCAMLDNGLKHRLRNPLGAGIIDGADQRNDENRVADWNDWCRQ